jgi:hypothetical protein
MLTADRHPCRDDLRLEGRGEPLRLRKPETEAGQVNLLVAFDTCELDLSPLPGLQLRHQLDPPHKFRRQLTLAP